ncbi:MAG: hypothetical protein K0R14_327 [Burkholderiales bacterium]|nr:hypothetical protein [Burkholderiales bacterium]
MIKYGSSGKPHKQIIPKYDIWGSSGPINTEQISIVNNKYVELLNLIDKQVNPEEYVLSVAKRISYFQGKELPALDAIWLRLKPKGSQDCLNSGHISLIYEEGTGYLLGYTRLDNNGSDKVAEHQMSLEKALQFLKKLAPDLIKYDTVTPQLNPIDIGSRMIFDPVLPIDNVELNWIDIHNETFNSYGKTNISCGLKVKMYLPKTSLWAWVIVDGVGRIITFERNVSWDFEKMERQTQMWLHDKWLIAKNIDPFHLAHNNQNHTMVQS